MTIDYSKTIIYKIICNDLLITECYVGHTTNIKNRITDHKNKINNVKNPKHHLKVYEFIRNNGGLDNWTFIELEKFPCENRNQAEERERYWYDELKPILNSQRPKITKEESIILHNEKTKEWGENNIEYRKEYKKQYQPLYYQKNKDKLLEYAKEYRNKNKEQIKQKMKAYYEKNKAI